MSRRVIFVLSALGFVAGLLSAYIYGIQKKPLPPVFPPASNPYARGIYSEGIIESYQTNGENINIYPEVQGAVTAILASEGSYVKRGEPLFSIDDSIQRAATAQQKAQAAAAGALLAELKAQPRKENLAVAKSQLDLADAGLRTARDQFEKLKEAYKTNRLAVSRNDLDNAADAVRTAEAGLDVARSQYKLVKAGAWVYDIRNQQHQFDALTRAYLSSKALLDKFVVKAPVEGRVLSINAAVGSYASPQGVYGTYTEGFNPAVVMGGPEEYIGVRCYIDEILINRLPLPSRIQARMSIRGTDVRIPIEFVRIQPYVKPKIELSNERTEKVDLRVLPVLFRFKKPKDVSIYPGQLVDVFVGER